MKSVARIIIVFLLLFHCQSIFSITLSEQWGVYIAPENAAAGDGGGKLEINRGRLIYILLGQLQASEFINGNIATKDWFPSDASPRAQLFGVVMGDPVSAGERVSKPSDITFGAVVWSCGYVKKNGHTPWPHSQAWVRGRIVKYLKENKINAEIAYFGGKGEKKNGGVTYQWVDGGKVVVVVREIFGVQTNVTFIRPEDYKTVNLDYFEHIYDGIEDILVLPRGCTAVNGVPIPNDQ